MAQCKATHRTGEEESLGILINMSRQRKGKLVMDPLSESSHYFIMPPGRSPEQIVANEIMFMIIDYFIPPTGLCLSNEPERLLKFKTIKALARVSRCVRSEVLSKIFKRPLNLYIASGYMCRCQELSAPQHILRGAPWEELNNLPWKPWRNLTVTFAPWIEYPLCRSEEHEWARNPPPQDERRDLEFKAATLCVLRQSYCIGIILQARLRHRSRPVMFTSVNYVFEDFWTMELPDERIMEELLHLPHDLFANDCDVEPLEVRLLRPIYHLHTVVAILASWKWTGHIFDSGTGVPNILFPRFSLALAEHRAMSLFGIHQNHPDLGLRVAEAAGREFSTWWLSRWYLFFLG